MAEHPHFDDEGHDIDEPVEGKQAQPHIKSKVQQFKTDDGLPGVRSATTVDEVPEEHVYVFYKNAFWEMVLEVDLLGDQAVFRSDGKIPPVIHILCPKCARSGHRNNALSITHVAVGGTKGFEIEELDASQWGMIEDPQTHRPVMASNGAPAIVSRRLTIKESFKCEYCNARYKITDNQMRDA
jgi:hypothetical protein